MLEQQFISELEAALKPLPTLERQEVIADYRAHFKEARERGQNEAAVAAALGDPRNLGRAFIADYHLKRISQPLKGQRIHTSVYHLLRAFIVLISILAFNFIFMLLPIIGMVVMLGCLWFVVISVIAAAFLAIAALLSSWIFGPLVLNYATVFALLFYGLSLCTGAALLCYILFAMSRWFLIVLMKYIKLNIKIIQPQKGA